MGQKSNPIILRLNKTNQHWNSCWYNDDDYATPFLQDCKINAYIKNSQQQLKRFAPVSFIKRQRGDLQIALFSAKPAQQFSNQRYGKHNKNLASRSQTPTLRHSHHIFKKFADYSVAHGNVNLGKVNIAEQFIHRNYAPPNGMKGGVFLLKTPHLSPQDLNPLLKKKDYFKSCIFLAIIAISRGALKTVLNGVTSADATTRHFPKVETILSKGTLAASNHTKLDITKSHLEYSIYKYYNEYNGTFTPVRNKLYLVKSPSIYQNPLFLASQVISLLEERAVFRKIKHRIVKEIQKSPIIKGVRIVCSGRVPSRSKKAQKARRDSIQWGTTSLNVFSAYVNFASCFAQTTFGKIGVKVWISYSENIKAPQQHLA